MPDMLVKLYELPGLASVQEEMAAQNIMVRKCLAPEKHIVLWWIKKHFNPSWASEADKAFANHPITCLVAVDEKGEKIAGFACYESTMRNFFGPIGVLPAYRGRGVGKALFLESLYGLKNLGYAYCIIGGAGPVEFYARTAGAVLIEGSVPGIYRGLLRK